MGMKTTEILITYLPLLAFYLVMIYVYRLGKGKIKVSEQWSKAYKDWISVNGTKISKWAIRAVIVVTFLHLLMLFGNEG